MKVSELADLAEQLLEVHRQTLLIDPFFKITIEISEGEYISSLVKESTSALTWKIKLHPMRHNSIADTQYSIIDALIQILFDGIEGEKVTAVTARLTSALCEIFSESEDDED